MPSGDIHGAEPTHTSNVNRDNKLSFDDSDYDDISNSTGQERMQIFICNLCPIIF